MIAKHNIPNISPQCHHDRFSGSMGQRSRPGPRNRTDRNHNAPACVGTSEPVRYVERIVGSQPPPVCCHASHILFYYIEDCSRGALGEESIHPSHHIPSLHHFSTRYRVFYGIRRSRGGKSLPPWWGLSQRPRTGENTPYWVTCERIWRRCMWGVELGVGKWKVEEYAPGKGGWRLGTH